MAYGGPARSAEVALWGVGTIASSGSTIITAKTGRLKRRIAAAVVVLVVAVIGGVLALTGAFDGGRAGSGDTVAMPDAKLPDLGAAQPVLAALAKDAPAPDPAALSAAIAPLLGAPALGTGVSASVVDVTSGDVLLDQDAEEPSMPASTAKLLTAVAALTTLDPSDTLKTTVVAGTAPGEVVLVGGGDPTLSRTAPSQTYAGAPTVADLAAQVVKAAAGRPAGHARRRRQLALQRPPHRERMAAQRHPLQLRRAGDRHRGGRRPARARARPRAAASRDSTPGPRSRTPSAPRAPPSSSARRRRAAKTLATVHSAPIERLVEQALSMSDNMLAEALARQVALARNLPASFEGSAKAVTGALTDLGVDLTGVKLSDGSGLSREDRVPVEVLTALLRGAADGSLDGASPVLSGLPVAGYDGTLFDRGDADPADAPGTVRAKTGTLLGIHALAGTVVTADGRLLTFAVIADNRPAARPRRRTPSTPSPRGWPAAAAARRRSAPGPLARSRRDPAGGPTVRR